MVEIDNEFWNKRREHLEMNVVNAVLDLFGHMGAHTFLLPIKGTTPSMFVIAGDEDTIKNWFK